MKGLCLLLLCTASVAFAGTQKASVDEKPPQFYGVLMCIQGSCRFISTGGAFDSKDACENYVNFRLGGPRSGELTYRCVPVDYTQEVR